MPDAKNAIDSPAWVYPAVYRYADILLINAPQRRYSTISPRFESERVLPPIGLAYLATYLEHRGLRAAILDGEFFGLSTDEIISAAVDFDCTAYGINCYSPTAPLTYEIAGGLRSTNRPIYVGGVHATYKGHDILAHCPFVRVIPGYAEEALFNALRNSPVTAEKERVMPLSLWLSRKHLASDPHVKRGLLSSSLLTSRGCPYNCSFCTSAQTQYTLRDVNDVAREASNLAEYYHVRHLQFLDDLFLLNPRRTKAFGQAFTTAGLTNVTWQGLATVKTLFLHCQNDCISLLRDSGCVRLSIGFESGSQRIRAIAGKEYSEEMAIRCVEDCSRVGIGIKGFFMVGFPGETRAEVENTVKFIFRLKSVGLRDISLFQVKLYPGTRLIDIARRHLGPEPVEEYYEYDLRSQNLPVIAMRALSRESFGSRAQLSALSPDELEQIISNTTRDFYER